MSSSFRPRAAWGTLSETAVVEAALALTEREGLDALSIRRLAEELGVGRMSLYRHVESKEALVGLVLDAVAERELLVTPRPDVPWREELADAARRIRAQMSRYPGLAHGLLTASVTGPANRRFAESLLGTLHRAGFEGDALVAAYLTFVDTVLGRIYREDVGDFAANRRLEAFTGGAPGRTPLLDSLSERLVGVDADVVFENMLDVLLDGLAARLAQ